MKIHTTLLRQIKESKLDSYFLTTKEGSSFLEKINNFYLFQDIEQERVSLAIDTLTSENDLLLRNLKEKSKQAIAESKMSILGEMSAGIAHEINNPLMILQNILDLIEFQKDDADLMQDNLKEASKAMERIEKIVKGLKTFSRNGANDPYSRHNLHEIVSETLAMSTDLVKKNKISVEVDIPKEMEIFCHPSEISQVFLNLLINSKDAISDSREKWIKIMAKQINETILIQFIDSGSGIPLHIQEKLMNPFFTTKPVGKGTGLGLSISKGIIESHRGKISVNNSIGNTCFDICFPKNI